jgi:hypothetical protein
MPKSFFKSKKTKAAPSKITTPTCRAQARTLSGNAAAAAARADTLGGDGFEAARLRGLALL